ncbi:hypothetical protein GCM10007884_22060 [Methylobacterium brachythecii]|nr:hypothetical protein GCM10007884_22060 [Methylobacterium brachythecii]
MPGKSIVLYKSPRQKLRFKNKTTSRAAQPPAVIKTARVVDEATQTAFDRFEAKSDLGQPVQVDVPSEKSENMKEVLGELRKHNAAVTTKGSADVIQAAIDAAPLRHIRHAAQPGWHQGQQDIFVRPTHVVGAKLGVEELQPPRVRPGEKRQIVFSNGGTIEGWRHEVARHARWSSRATLMIGAAFAGPLLRVLGYQSFGVMLFGPPKVGKSTAQLAGGSVVGLRNEEAMPSFKATSVGMDLIAITCNDGMLPINEAALLGRDAYAKLSPMIYGLSEGKDKVRHGESLYASDVSASGWSLVYAMSSENSVEALAAQSGMTRQGGEVARCLDVPALRGDHATIFDLRPRGLSDEDFEKGAHWRMKKIREGCEDHHGVVFDAYLRGLMAFGDDLKPKAQAYVDEFVRKLRLRDADGAVNHAARNFGAIYAGLRFAMDMKVLERPWRPLTARKAIALCFRDGIKVSRLRDTTLEEAKAILQKRLQEASLPRKETATAQDVGFRTMEGTDEYVAVRSTEFVRWFGSKRELLIAVLAWLDEQRALKKAGPEKRPRGNGYGWAVTTPRCPAWKERCFVFRQPIST